MGFTDNELKLLFNESNRVLKNKGLLSFSLRSDKDIMYKKGTKVIENIYNINGFQLRFFTKQDIELFIRDNFKIQNIIEDYEEPASLYSVNCYKN
jgi:hypothetical protein